MGSSVDSVELTVEPARAGDETERVPEVVRDKVAAAANGRYDDDKAFLCFM
jgi:hypothetical protein